MITWTPSYHERDLPEVFAAINRISKHYGLSVANVFHAGDGNLHPLILFDTRFPDQVEKILQMNEEIMKLCVGVGGSLSGEHGIGYEKKDFMGMVFTTTRLDDHDASQIVFNPDGSLGSRKIFPTHRACTEIGKPLDDQHRRNRKRVEAILLGLLKRSSVDNDGLSLSKDCSGRNPSKNSYANSCRPKRGVIFAIGAGTQTFSATAPTRGLRRRFDSLFANHRIQPGRSDNSLTSRCDTRPTSARPVGEQSISASGSLERFRADYRGWDCRGEFAGTVSRRGYDPRLDHWDEGRRVDGRISKMRRPRR